MLSYSKKILSSFFYLALLAGYSVFFYVQLTSNFEIAANFQQSAKQSVQNCRTQEKHKTIAKANTNRQKKVKFRLNKRFHPVYSLYEITTLLHVPEFPTNQKFNPDCFNRFVPSTYLLNSSERGPPVIS